MRQRGIDAANTNFELAPFEPLQLLSLLASAIGDKIAAARAPWNLPPLVGRSVWDLRGSRWEQGVVLEPTAAGLWPVCFPSGRTEELPLEVIRERTVYEPRTGRAIAESTPAGIRRRTQQLRDQATKQRQAPKQHQHNQN